MTVRRGSGLHRWRQVTRRRAASRRRTVLLFRKSEVSADYHPEAARDRSMQVLHRSMPDLAWTQNAARPRDDVGDIAPTLRVHREGRPSRPNLQAAINSGRAQTERNIHGHDEHRSLASGIGRWRGAMAGSTCRAGPRPGERDEGGIFRASDHEAAESARLRRAILPRWCVCNA